MAEWSKNQQDEFTGLYRQYQRSPHYDKAKSDNILFSEQLPYNEARGRLQRLIDEGKKQSSGLEAIAESAFDSGRMPYAAGLAAVLVAVALASLGMPYAPPPLY